MIWKRKLGLIFPDCLGWKTFEGARREMEDPPLKGKYQEWSARHVLGGVSFLTEMLPVLLQMHVIEE